MSGSPEVRWSGCLACTIIFLSGTHDLDATAKLMAAHLLRKAHIHRGERSEHLFAVGQPSHVANNPQIRQDFRTSGLPDNNKKPQDNRLGVLLY
jgi:hypothetical protein